MYGVVEKTLSARDIINPMYDVANNPPVDRVSAAHNAANVVDSSSGARATNNSAYDKNPPDGATATNNPAYGVIEKVKSPNGKTVRKNKNPPSSADSPKYNKVGKASAEFGVVVWCTIL